MKIAPDNDDAALKDILNGDLPPGGDPLAGLEGELGADSASQDGVGAADSENLFRRVNAFYIKCQKTGCVAHGVGDTI